MKVHCLFDSILGLIFWDQPCVQTYRQMYTQANWLPPRTTETNISQIIWSGEGFTKNDPRILTHVSFDSWSLRLGRSLILSLLHDHKLYRLLTSLFFTQCFCLRQFLWSDGNRDRNHSANRKTHLSGMGTTNSLTCQSWDSNPGQVGERPVH